MEVPWSKYLGLERWQLWSERTYACVKQSSGHPTSTRSPFRQQRPYIDISPFPFPASWSLSLVILSESRRSRYSTRYSVVSNAYTARIYCVRSFRRRSTSEWNCGICYPIGKSLPPTSLTLGPHTLSPCAAQHKHRCPACPSCFSFRFLALRTDESRCSKSDTIHQLESPSCHRHP